MNFSPSLLARIGRANTKNRRTLKPENKPTQDGQNCLSPIDALVELELERRLWLRRHIPFGVIDLTYDCRALQVSTVGGVVLRVDQAALAYQAFHRQQRECGEDAGVVRFRNLRADCHRQKWAST
jgi:hypothetical protein